MAVALRRGAPLLRRSLRAAGSQARFLTVVPPSLLSRPRAAVQQPLSRARRFSAITVKCPGLGGESISEGTVMEWLKKAGDAVKKGEVVVTIETDKVTVDVAAEAAGVIQEVLVQVDDTVLVGQEMFVLDASEGAAAAAPSPAASAPAASTSAAAPAAGKELKGIAATFAYLAAVRAARKAGQSPPPRPASVTAVPDAAAGAQAAAPTPIAAAAAPAAPAAPAATPAASTGPLRMPSREHGLRSERRVPISHIRARAMARIKETQNTCALLTTFQEADMGAALELHKKHKDAFQKKHGVPLGYLSLFVKAASATLMDIPAVNATILDESKETLFRDYVDFSVPIASPVGPVNCTIRNVQSKTVAEVEKAIAGLTSRAKDNKLTPEDMSSPTCGISDTGSAGGYLGTCMLNPPMSAIIGTNAIKLRPTVVGGKVVSKPMMMLALTYDHRQVDGKEAVTFLCGVRDKMEDPARLMLEL